MGKRLFDVVVMQLEAAELVPQDRNKIMGQGQSAAMDSWVTGCETSTKYIEINELFKYLCICNIFYVYLDHL